MKHIVTALVVVLAAQAASAHQFIPLYVDSGFDTINPADFQDLIDRVRSAK